MLRSVVGLLSLIVHVYGGTHAENVSNSVSSAWNSGGISSFQQTPFAEYWDTLDGNATTLKIDSFHGRMTLYKQLIQATPAFIPAVEEVGPGLQLENQQQYHFLWAYAAQLDWQWRSGRLSYPTHTHTPSEEGPDAISADSWWGNCNYVLSVVIAMGAQKAGVYDGSVVFNSTTLHSSATEAHKAVDLWARVFTILQEALTPSDTQLDTHTHRSPEFLDKLRGYVWEAHTQSLDFVMPYVEDCFALMPEEEQVFARGWAAYVHILAAARSRTDLANLAVNGARYLPNCILNGSEITIAHLPPWLVTDKPKSVRKYLKRLQKTVKAVKESLTQSPSQKQFLLTVLSSFEGRQQFSSVSLALLYQEGFFWWTKIFKLFRLWFRGRKSQPPTIEL